MDRDQLSIMGLRGDMPSCSPNRPGEACILSKNDGTSVYGTIVTISESSLVPGLVWVGTDDGAVQVSRDGGTNWTNVTANLRVPEHYYVSRVEASHFDAGTAYVSLDGHRSDDLKPYVYVTRDYGATWTSIASRFCQKMNPATATITSAVMSLICFGVMDLPRPSGMRGRALQRAGGAGIPRSHSPARRRRSPDRDFLG